MVQTWQRASRAITAVSALCLGGCLAPPESSPKSPTQAKPTASTAAPSPEAPRPIEQSAPESSAEPQPDPAPTLPDAIDPVESARRDCAERYPPADAGQRPAVGEKSAEGPARKVPVPPAEMRGMLTGPGRLPPEVVQCVVRGGGKSFRACYEAGLARDPKLQGRVSVAFVIDEKGAVRDVADADSDLPDPKVIECVVDAYTRLTFPEPKGGSINVTYPILFAPGPGKGGG